MKTFLIIATAISIIGLNIGLARCDEIINGLVAKLGLDQQFSVEPCRLMPFVELSPLLAMARVSGIAGAMVNKTQQAYYKIGLGGMLYVGCLMRIKLGDTKAKAVLQQWVSGYVNPIRKTIVMHDFQTSINDGGVSTNNAECLAKAMDRLKNSEVTVNPGSLITAELAQQSMLLQSKALIPEEMKAATEAVAAQCLLSTPGLSDSDKAELVGVLKEGAKFFHHIEGGVLRTIVGENSQSEVITTLLRGIIKAKYLPLHEKMARLGLLLDGDNVSNKKCMNKSVEECIQLIQATF
eukprot:gene14161-15640_t